MDDPSAEAISLAIATATDALAVGDLASLQVAEAAIKAVTPSRHGGGGGKHDSGGHDDGDRGHSSRRGRGRH